MSDAGEAAGRRRLAAMHARLVDWLVGSALPLWARRGVDAVTGGFVECLAQDGTVPGVARRARVPARQIFVFAQAPRFGWKGDAAGIVARGLEEFVLRHRRPDGLFRTLVACDGSVLSDDALLYDQAFALLAFAAAATLGDPQGCEAAALALRKRIEVCFGTAEGAFRASEQADAADDSREANPHMHLLEACQAWARIGADPGWSMWSHRLTDLALCRFARSPSGAFGEIFTHDWRPAPGPAGSRIEPGHQFEWAWLLLRQTPAAAVAHQTALRLQAIGEGYGIVRGAVVDAWDADLAVARASARLWPQTERLKAALAIAAGADQDRAWSIAADAAESLLPYLATPMAGLWFDRRTAEGAYPATPAPASSLYHLVGAIAELDAAAGSRRFSEMR